MLPKKAIEEFKKIYKKHYGVELPDQEAAFRANNLVNLYKAVYSDPPFGRVDKKENYEAQRMS